jgi:hypothetical protein
MDSFGDLGGGGGRSSSKAASFLQLPLPASTSSAQQVFPPPDGRQHHSSRFALQQLLADPSAAQQHSHQKDAAAIVQGEMSSPPADGDADTIKAKIMSHPQYSALLAAYLDCQKVSTSGASMHRTLFNQETQDIYVYKIKCY